MEAEDNLLFISNGKEEEKPLIEGLEDRGWRVTRISGEKEISGAYRYEDHEVGVLFLEPFHLDDSSRFEPVINSLRTRMIAIASQEVMGRIRDHQGIGRIFFGYHIPPVDIDRLHHALENLLSIIRLESTFRDKEKLQETGDCQMVGNSPVMKSLFRSLHKVAIVDAPVLIQGESGTGKELAAKAIHRESTRAEAPFNAINCGALPANLIQSELFGHEKGAFTGATQRKIGIIEHTDGGTLFLDEIGDLPLDMQVNLLRFLENRTIQRVGGLKEIEVDLRVLAATHVELERAVSEGKFREDLYHRLNVLQVKVPPLRDRGEDISMLAHYFFNKFTREKSLVVNGFSKDSLAVMQCYEWPGNIRELINRVRRAMVMSEHPLICPEDLGLERRQSHSRYASSLEEARDMAERGVVMSSLARNAFNVQNAARDLGISRVTLYRLMDKHHISRGKKHMEKPPSDKEGETLSQNVLSFVRGRKNP